MTPLVKRLQQYMQYKNLELPDLIRLLDVSSPEKIYRLFREGGEKEANPSVEILSLLSNKLDDLNLHWLITGHGEMLLGAKSYKDKKQTTTTAEPQEDYKTLEARIRKIEERLKGK